MSLASCNSPHGVFICNFFQMILNHLLPLLPWFNNLALGELGALTYFSDVLELDDLAELGVLILNGFPSIFLLTTWLDWSFAIFFSSKLSSLDTFCCNFYYNILPLHQKLHLLIQLFCDSWHYRICRLLKAHNILSTYKAQIFHPTSSSFKVHICKTYKHFIVFQIWFSFKPSFIGGNFVQASCRRLVQNIYYYPYYFNPINVV